MAHSQADMLDALAPLVPALRRYARGLLRDRNAADDLVQECLERALDRWDQRRNVRDPRPWLFSILHNLAISQLRQQRRRGLHVAIEDAGPLSSGRSLGQEQSVQHAELLRALARLTDEHRTVLLLVAVEDLSYAEAAEVLGVPLGTVMSRLSRAREALGRLLEGEPPVRERRPTLRRLK